MPTKLDHFTLISVSIKDDQERQTADRTFSVTLSSDPPGADFIPRKTWSFTIPPNDLEVMPDGPVRFEKDATTLTLTFTTDGLQNSKTFAVSSPDTRVAVQTGLITTYQDSFDVVLSLTEGAELERRETIELTISHLDALSVRDSAQISTGELHACAIRDDNTAACWGRNATGQASPPEGEFLSVSAALEHTCGIRIDNTIACWGRSANNRVPPPSAEIFLSVGSVSLYTCAIRIDNTVKCWGVSPPGDKLLALSAGEWHACGIRINNTVACWGSNSVGEASPPEGRFLAVSAGGGIHDGNVATSAHTCGILMDDGTVACWGDDIFNQKDLTDSSQGDVSNRKFLAIEAGRLHTCGILMDDGTAACWGNKNLNRSSPTSSSGDQGGPVREKDRFLAVSAGGSHTCAVRENAAAACWGRSAERETVPSSAEGGFQKAAVIPDTFYLLEKQDMNVPLEIRSSIRLRIKVFLEGALR